MKVKEFSDESVKLAEAGYLLELCTVEKYERPLGNHFITGVRLCGVNKSLELDKNKFPELDVGDNVSLLYVMHFKECNEIYKKNGLYQI